MNRACIARGEFKNVMVILPPVIALNSLRIKRATKDAATGNERIRHSDGIPINFTDP